jgi:glutathione S-transferase
MPKIIRGLVTPRLRSGVVKRLVARDVWRAGPERCWERFETLLADLDERAPREGFWVGPEITVADLSLFGQLHSLRCGLTPRQAEAIGRRRHLSKYLDTVHAATSHARPAPAKGRTVELVALLTG